MIRGLESLRESSTGETMVNVRWRGLVLANVNGSLGRSGVHSRQQQLSLRKTGENKHRGRAKGVREMKEERVTKQ